MLMMHFLKKKKFSTINLIFIEVFHNSFKNAFEKKNPEKAHATLVRTFS